MYMMCVSVSISQRKQRINVASTIGDTVAYYMPVFGCQRIATASYFGVWSSRLPVFAVFA